jgi:monofunctional biosynthetic peptidoglycan transglycosylase
MNIVTLLAGLSLSLAGDSLTPERWVVVNDGVMGGLSRGQVQEQNGILVFSGVLSLDNNGGFSSIRLPLENDLSDYSGIRMSVRGDGRRYQVRLRHGLDWDGVAWRREFTAGPDWSVIEIPFDEFEAGYRGRNLPQSRPVDPSRVGQIGFLLGDKRAGTFRLEVKFIEGLPL